jgi:hypothetical protein
MAGQADMGQILGQQLLQAAQVMEEQVDDEISKLERLDEDELEIIKQRRIDAMKKAQEKKQEYLKQGHGEYEEIPEEKEFFNVGKNSENVVCHFYKDDTFRCKIVDKHMKVLARKHIETKFCKINAERCQWLCERLRIKVIPTIALLKDSKTKDYIVGFADLGNQDEFSTEMLEWRIAQAGVLNYKGDLMTPPDEQMRKKKTNFVGKKTKMARKGDNDDSSDENDW